VPYVTRSNLFPTSIRIALTGVSTALVCVATIIFSIYVPQTRGFFNLGETMVYAVALLLGPIVGSFAGGVGSMLADLLLGYYYYAPATLVIKALEGGLVGFLGQKGKSLYENHTPREWKIFTSEIGILVGMLIGLVGFLFYSGSVELSTGITSGASTIFIPGEFWLALGAGVAILIGAISAISEPEFGLMIISAIFGGLVMVTGYFLYEQLFLGVFAFAEVPFNFGQMTVGLIVGTSIVKLVRRAVPQLRK
jgi:uncharacterized membrane protein